MNEDKTVEYKESTKSPTYLKVVSAFANYCDGKIIFGITDSGEKMAIENIDQEKLRIENSINDNIRPIPYFSLHEENGLIVLYVKKGDFTPYLYNGKAYKRSDTSAVPVDDVEKNRLILEGRNLDFEDIRSRYQELTFDCLSQHIISALKISEFNTDTLKTLQLYSDNTGYNLAAYLLSDNLAGVGIDIMRFGASIDIIEKRMTLTSGSIIQQFEDVLDFFREYYIVEQISGDKREILELIPLVAFREAIANAIVHRAWDVNANIKVSMYKDSIEIASPGGLSSQISKEEYLNGQISILRNPIIADIFFKLGFIEKFGTGIKRIKYAYRNSTSFPRFNIYDNSIGIQLPVINGNEITAEEKMIFEIIRSSDYITTREIIEKTGFEKSKVIRIINKLKERNLILAEGKGPSVKYIYNFA